tara:strand:- start:386 stop:904 length:519 start_codon:yes stop_codon:yes gene_type:complete
MALWGKKDTVYSSGKVNCNAAGVVTRHNGTIDWTANNVAVGQVLTLATDGAGPGQGIIMEIVSNHEIKLDPERLDLPGTFSAVDYEIRETPVYEVRTGSFGINEIFGVSVAEAQAARDDKSQYKPACSGWVGITSYTDMHGNQRVKTETLVAGGGDGFITGDSGDDNILPDT